MHITCRGDRRSIRLPNYDYSLSGYYSVTICTAYRECYFGGIPEEKMMLSNIGKTALQCWQEIPDHFPAVNLDEYVIMPDHIHGIIVINDTGKTEERINKYQHVIPRSIGAIVRGFKIGVTKWCKNNKIPFGWQRSFYERIIRNEEALDEIRRYIINNPAKWAKEKNNPINLRRPHL